MPNWSGTVLTAKGRALQAKVEAGTAMNIMKLKIGDGTLGTGQTVDTLTDLVAPKQIIPISALTPLDAGICKVTAVVTNDGMETGLYVRELGIFAQDPDIGEILYAYTADGAPDFIPAAGGSVAVSLELVINLAFSNAATITANIALDGLVTVNVLNSAISQHNTSLTAHKDLLHLWQPGHAYAVGDIAYNHNLPSWAYLECVHAGTSGNDDTIFTDISSGGGVISDNTVSWAVRDLRVSDAQFDVSTKLATTAYLKSAGMFYGKIVTVGGTITLDASYAGQVIQLYSASAFTVTLPAAANIPSGETFTFVNRNTGTATINVSGSDTIAVGASNLSSIAVKTGETLTLASNGINTWFAIAGSAQIIAAGSIVSHSGSSSIGWTKWADGTMIQQGAGNCAVDIVFPIVFYEIPIVVGIHPGTDATTNIIVDNTNVSASKVRFTTSHSNTNAAVWWTAKGRWKA